MLDGISKTVRIDYIAKEIVLKVLYYISPNGIPMPIDLRNALSTSKKII